MSYDKHKIPVYKPEEGYDKYAGYYDKDEGYLDSIDKEFLVFTFKSLQGKKVLDVGCGTGRNTIRLFRKGVDIEGLDISENMLSILKRKDPGIKTVQGDVDNLPYKDEIFDAVICNLLFVHLKKPEETLQEIYRVLKNDGEFFLSIIHQKKPPVLKTKQESFKIKSYFYSARKMRGLLEEEAFKILDEKIMEENRIPISTFFRCRK